MKKTINKIALILLIFWSINAYAQTPSFDWAVPSKHPEISEYKSEVVEASDKGFYRIMTKYNLDIFQTEMFIEKYDNRFEKVSSITATPTYRGLEPDLRTYTNHLYKDGKILMFTSNFEKAKQRNFLYVHDVSLDGEFSNERQIAYFKAEKRMQQGDYQMAFSDDKNYTVVVQERPFAKKQNEKMGLMLFDKNLEVAAKGEFTLPYPSARAVNHEPFVNNNGDVFIIKKVKDKKLKHHYEILFWDKATKKVVPTLIDAKDKEVVDIKATIKPNGNFVVYAYFADDIFTKTDRLGGLYYEFSSEGKVINQEIHALKKTVADLTIKAIEFTSTGDILILSERYKHESQLTGTGEAANRNHTYDNKSIAVQRLDNNGKATAMTFVSKDNQSSNDGGYLNSFAYVIRDNKAYVFFNHPEDVYAVEGRKPSFRKVFVMVVVDEAGNQKGYNMYDNGVGVEYGEMPYCPNEFYKISDDFYIMKAASTIEYKFGKMKF